MKALTENDDSEHFHEDLFSWLHAHITKVKPFIASTYIAVTRRSLGRTHERDVRPNFPGQPEILTQLSRVIWKKTVISCH